MCLAIYKPKGVTIAKKALRNGFDNNEDGAGFAVCDDGTVRTYKGYFSFGAFWKAYKPFQNQVAIIHFRWATHGTCSPENCHPFTVCGDNYAVIHNGILDISTESDKDKSDTRHFAELVLTPVLEMMPMDNPALRYLMETSIGSGNKIVVLRGDGAHVIFNEKKGTWHKGAWFSNDGYLRRNPMLTGSYSRNYAGIFSGKGNASHNGATPAASGRVPFPDYEEGGADKARGFYDEEWDDEDISSQALIEAEEQESLAEYYAMQRR